ncbi:S-adenosyl-L-methionine-dependent methyltransferase [Pseudoneurospora amorphoporcata]|uniref:S-adenosyl-L-methionine-dependent methyltransferase n=1 Tax=Pseudoneurospora amorphoporcata TaxID=241081 RepID=A0AAN6P3A4_9PEZI|nr:S-adenosyl-L-methionine-dependent methyltransferase [Pseudoneurospora amorphoporcata]
MSTPLKRKPQSPAPGSAVVAKARTSTSNDTLPGPAASGAASPGPASPAARTKSPTPAVEAPAIESPNHLPGSHWLQQGLPQHDNDDTESTLGSDVDSSTASISSSILNYRTINGRTYHSNSVTDGEYWAPNDPKHIEALDLYYHAADMMFGGKLHRAPLIEGKFENAIDIGTGSGWWAIDFADKYAKCNVIGTDISPVQPSWVPPNLQFEINDATKEWTYRENHFDYIHMQFLNGAFGDLKQVYDEAFRCCKPGGWFEHADTSAILGCDDGTFKDHHALMQWGKIYNKAAQKLGIIMTMAEDGLMEKTMRDAGFVNVKVVGLKMPLSPWPQDPKEKEIGRYASVTISSDVEGLIQYMFGNVLGWSKEEMAVYSAHVRRELKDASLHGYSKWQVVYGQKPE